MRTICLCNNWLGWQVLRWLKDRGEEIVALVVHSPERASHAEEIRSVVADTGCLVLFGSQLQDANAMQRIRETEPEIAVSVLFAHILRKNFLELPSHGCINLHPGLLPYNRGAYPNVWSIVEKTPAGVSIHYIDEGVDTGDVIAQREVPVLATDTGASLYYKLEVAGLELFKETWPSIRSSNCRREPQIREAGTYHRVKDVERIDEIDSERSYKAGDLLNIIRARTFPPHRGAYFLQDGRRIYVRLQMLDESELPEK